MLKTTMLGLSLLVMCGAVTLCGQASAAERGSAEDQMACTPDVYRLCSSYVPDEDAIVSCLTRNMRALTPACQKVMSRPPEPKKGAGDEDTD